MRILVASRRPADSDALATWSYLISSQRPLRAWTCVIAAVSVVLPWSTWPMVPTFTCGFPPRSNVSLAIFLTPVSSCSSFASAPCWSHLAESNRRPHPYQGCALPTELKWPPVWCENLDSISKTRRQAQGGIFHRTNRVRNWWRRRGSNPRPKAYESFALPTELPRQCRLK